jgi:hypothetical protein
MLSWVPHWLKKAAPPPVPPAEFSVACVCGRVVTGTRLNSPQNLFCPSCGGEIFVLPAGPWLELAKTVKPRTAPSSRSLTVRDLLLPLGASALAVTVLALAYSQWVVPLVFPKRVEPSQGGDAGVPTLKERLARGHKLLTEGSFRLAMEEMNPAARPLDLSPLDGAERRRWRQVQRQAALFADLLPEPLEDIIRHGAGVKEQEWQADFRHRFLGKALVLDAEFRKPPGGTWEVLYPLFHGQDRARLIVADLKILESVPSAEPLRLVVGVRLASVRLENPGPAWVVRFEPDSGVFVTDSTAAFRVCPALAAPEALSVLERQKGWID